MSHRQIVGLLAAALASFSAFAWFVWSTKLQGLDLGSLWLPSPGYTRFLLVWTLWCTATVVPASLALAALVDARIIAGGTELSDRVRAWASDDRVWMATGGLLAFALANWVNVLVLAGGSVVDDESVYQFCAELLASGRLYAESPEPWIFWERIFIVNDGKWYGQYFLGWPLLMVPGIWLGVPEIMNPVYSGLTVPFLFLATRRIAGVLAARVATLLFVFSPMIVIAAATRMSHTTCLLALTMMLYFHLRTRGEDAGKPWPHAAMAFSFCMAFFIRPQTAVPLGLPLLVIWLIGHFRERRSWATFSVFSAVCLAMAAVFLGINYLQTGGAFYPAIQRVIDAQLEAGSPFSQIAAWPDQKVQNLSLDIGTGMLTVVSGITRLNYDAFGWPVSFLFVPFALAVRSTRGVWWMGTCFLLAMLIVTDAGIDVFGPSHFFELVLPMLVLSGAGVSRVQAFARQNASAFGSWRGIARRLPVTLVGTLIVVATFGFAPPRIAAAGRIAMASGAPKAQVEAAGIENAVLFGTVPHSPCKSIPTRSWVFWPPGNDPALSNDLLWVNHVNTEDDRVFMQRYFPDRKGYWYLWNSECELLIGSIDDAGAVSLPPNPRMGADYRVDFPRLTRISSTR